MADVKSAMLKKVELDMNYIEDVVCVTSHSCVKENAKNLFELVRWIFALALLV